MAGLPCPGRPNGGRPGSSGGGSSGTEKVAAPSHAASWQVVPTSSVPNADDRCNCRFTTTAPLRNSQTSIATRNEKHAHGMPAQVAGWCMVAWRHEAWVGWCWWLGQVGRGAPRRPGEEGWGRAHVGTGPMLAGHGQAISTTAASLPSRCHPAPPCCRGKQLLPLSCSLVFCCRKQLSWQLPPQFCRLCLGCRPQLEPGGRLRKCRLKG